MAVADGTASLPRRVLRREIGRAGGKEPGPTLLVVAGIHGNEPAGLDACARVFAHLEEHQVRLRGCLTGLAGNLAALATGERFVREDLNRVWTQERVARVNELPESAVLAAEDLEQRALLAAIHDVLRAATGPVYVLDLHTSSSDSVPFYILGDTLQNREFARRFPAPTVLGLEEHIRGTLNEYLTTLGHVAIAIEGGRHDDPRAIDHHEAAVWLALANIGCVAVPDVPEYDRHVACLQRAPGSVPPVVEIVHRHSITDADEFRMDPGFTNFWPVKRGQRVAVDRLGIVKSPADGLLFLPLYQKRGDDGFFLARAVNPVWLAMSAWLRRIGVPALATHLPGVREHPDRRDTIVVNLRVARFFARGFFRLLGYRVSEPRLGKLIVKKRREQA